jgi:DNA-binding SARP family transcriptional activator
MLAVQHSSISLEVLGGARLCAPTGKTWKPERKSAAILTYLALEGSTTRSRLAGLLWPDSLETTARNNLSQVARRLREAAGTALISGEDSLSLKSELHVDAAQLEVESFAGHDQIVIGLNGDLLEGLEYDDCPEFQDWLLSKRESLGGLRREAHLRCSQAAEQTGQFRLALEHASKVLELDPISEVAHRHVMRLHYQNGDRVAALSAFERCRQVLEQEIGVAPMPETLALAESISQGQAVERSAIGRKEIPVSILRPPMLIGRENEWKQLEHAWNNAQMILISGDAGSGKTRLATDFLASKGNLTRFEGRPGDALVSYSTSARIYRQLLAQHPLQLPDWVRLELSRILPELGTPSGPIQNESDKLRFHAAKSEAMLLAVRAGMQTMILDDLQFVDLATFEAGFQMWSDQVHSGLIKALFAYRESELSSPIRDRLQQAIASGKAVQVNLAALEQADVQTMLESFGLEGLERYGPTMYRATGGNPMFVLETTRSLVSNGMLEHAQATTLPLPESVKAVIQSRLAKLSVPGLRIARVASVAGSDFTLELAAKVLETKIKDLSENLQELEQHQIMHDQDFSHDLIAQATLEALPESIRKLLHERIADHLEKEALNPARIAEHWILANAEQRAVPFLEAAAAQANAKYQLREVIKHASRAAEILERNNHPALAWECWAQTKDAIAELAIDDELETVIAAMRRTTGTPRQQTESLEAECAMWTNRGHLGKAKRIAEESMLLAEKNNDLRSLELAENNLGMVCWMQGKSSLAERHFARSNEHAHRLLRQKIEQRLPDLEIEKAKQNLCSGITNHAVILDNFGRYQESELEHQHVIEMLRGLRNVFSLSQALSNISITYIEQGLAQKALVPLQEAEELEAATAETTINSVARRLNRCDALVMLDQYAQALEHALSAHALAVSQEHPQILGCLIRVANLYRILGDHSQASRCFEASHDLPGKGFNSTNSLNRMNALYQIEQHQDASETVLAAQQGLSKSDGVYRWYKTHLDLLAGLPAKQRMPIVNETLRKPGLQAMKGLQILALTRGAQQQLEHGKHKKALEFSQAAVRLLEAYDPELQRAEVLLTHQRALEANQHPEALKQLERVTTWLLEVADNNVPIEYRESFLTRNPHNAAILELARRAGIEIP